MLNLTPRAVVARGTSFDPISAWALPFASGRFSHCVVAPRLRHDRVKIFGEHPLFSSEKGREKKPRLLCAPMRPFLRAPMRLFLCAPMRLFLCAPMRPFLCAPMRLWAGWFSGLAGSVFDLSSRDVDRRSGLHGLRILYFSPSLRRVN